jgi:hypothetical protein
MPNVTMLFGCLLVVLGLTGYIATGSQHPTALIPAGFGLLIGFCGLVARKPGRRKLFMHVAVTLGLLGFLGTVPSIYKMFQIAQHQVVARHAAVYSQFIMCLLCLIFVILCVRSFIAARRTRTA